MKNTDKTNKGYNEKNPAQPQGSVNLDKKEEKLNFPATSSPNEKLSIPERKLKERKKQ